MIILSVIGSQALIQAFIYLVIIGLILWVLWWFINYIALPEPFGKVARVILALIAVIVLINLLLSLIGQPLI